MIVWGRWYTGNGTKSLDLTIWTKNPSNSGLWVLVDYGVKIKESKKDLAWELKNTMEHEDYGDINCDSCTSDNSQRIDNGNGRLGNKRTSRDHLDNSIIKIGQNTEKSPGDLRKLAVTQIPARNQQLTLVGKSLKGVNNDNNNILFLVHTRCSVVIAEDLMTGLLKFPATPALQLSGKFHSPILSFSSLVFVARGPIIISTTLRSTAFLGQRLNIFLIFAFIQLHPVVSWQNHVHNQASRLFSIHTNVLTDTVVVGLDLKHPKYFSFFYSFSFNLWFVLITFVYLVICIVPSVWLFIFCLVCFYIPLVPIFCILLWCGLLSFSIKSTFAIFLYFCSERINS